MMQGLGADFVVMAGAAYASQFDKNQLLDAFDEIAWQRSWHRRNSISWCSEDQALMLASNFRFSTEDVDIAEIKRPWPPDGCRAPLRVSPSVMAGCKIGSTMGQDFFLSPLVEYRRSGPSSWGTFPRAADKTGLRVFVPTARYMLALNFKAFVSPSSRRGPRISTMLRGFYVFLKYRSRKRRSPS